MNIVQLPSHKPSPSSLASAVHRCQSAALYNLHTIHTKNTWIWFFLVTKQKYGCVAKLKVTELIVHCLESVFDKVIWLKHHILSCFLFLRLRTVTRKICFNLDSCPSLMSASLRGKNELPMSSEALRQKLQDQFYPTT